MTALIDRRMAAKFSSITSTIIIRLHSALSVLAHCWHGWEDGDGHRLRRHNIRTTNDLIRFVEPTIFSYFSMA